MSLRYSAPLETPRYPWKEIPGSSHVMIRDRILSLPPDLAVLDLGFGAGLLASRIRPHCRFLAGIELDPDAAREGARYFDRPVVGDVLEALAGPWDMKFDVVVAGDILEHLPQPEKALVVLGDLVSPTGILLLSLPNVANVTVRLGLLFGRFDYTDRGILDRTHMRFFTRRSAVELLDRCGWQTRRCAPSTMPVELAIPWLGRPPLVAPVRALSRALALLRPTLFGYQFVLEAVRA